jgi:hypothetical protein
MLRFKPNDPVFVLPKYAHLYPGPSAVVTTAVADPFRSLFNEYAVTFPDFSRDKLFEFQIIEDLLDYRTFVASLVFDSQQHPDTGGSRGSLSGRQIILQTPGFDLVMTTDATKSRPSAMGQVLERGTKNLLKGLEVRLLKESSPIMTTMSDNLGFFKFDGTPRGSFNILVVVPQYSARILGAFMI